LLDAGVNGKPAVKPLARGSVDMCEEHLASPASKKGLYSPEDREYPGLPSRLKKIGRLTAVRLRDDAAT